MNKEEQLYLIEAVIIEVRRLLYKYWSDQMKYDDAMAQITTEIDRLQDLEPVKEPETKCFLLTKSNWGPPAYLWKLDSDSFVVRVQDEDLTHAYPSAIEVLDEYIGECEQNDFIEDFLVGVEDGTCEFGDNKYALYVEKCFNKYVFGKEL